MAKRKRSYILSGITAGALQTLGVALWINGQGFSAFSALFILSIFSFTLVSCLVLNNNFIEDLLEEIASWGFIRLPGLIFELSLDGIVWLLTVKLLFWILSFFIALLFVALALTIGGFLSLFVYPYALRKNLKGLED